MTLLYLYKLQRVPFLLCSKISTIRPPLILNFGYFGCGIWSRPKCALFYDSRLSLIRTDSTAIRLIRTPARGRVVTGKQQRIRLRPRFGYKFGFAAEIDGTPKQLRDWIVASEIQNEVRMSFASGKGKKKKEKKGIALLLSSATDGFATSFFFCVQLV